MTTQFEIPNFPLTATELQLPAATPSVHAAHAHLVGADGVAVSQDMPDRTRLLAYLTSPTSATLEHILLTSGVGSSDYHVYGVPQVRIT
jgi:hypothetical protein